VSLALLYQEANAEPLYEAETEAAKEIVELLGHLPLAIELAGAFMKYDHVSFESYRDLLKSDLTAALPEEMSSFTKHEPNLAKTLHIDERILKKHPLLKEILDILTWSGSDPMGIELLSSLLDKEPVHLTRDLSVGVALRLLQETTATKSYSIHRLVRQFRKNEIPLAERSEWVEQTAQRMGDWFEAKRQDFIYLPEFERQIEHLSAWQNNVSKISAREYCRLLWLQAYPPYHRRRYEESKAIIDKALQIYETSHIDAEQLKAHLLTDKGYLEGETGNKIEELDFYQQALSIRKKIFGDKHRDTAASLSHIGSVYRDLGLLQEALEFNQQALEINQELFGDKHPTTAASLNNLGSVYKDLGQLQEALKFNQQAFEINQELFGDKHPTTATSLNNLGSVYKELGQLQEALNLYQKDLDISKEVLGDKHPDTATSLNNLGTVYQDLGQFREALKFSQQAFSIRQELFGDKHPTTATSLNNLGSVYKELGQLQEALKFNQQAFEIKQELFGDKHPTTATSLNNLGSVYFRLNNFAEALDHFQQAYKILTGTNGFTHPNTITALKWLTDTLGKLNRHRESFDLLDATLLVLPTTHKDFRELEERAINFLKKSRSQVGIKQVIDRQKQKWRQAKKP
jgi:tetratricopeptide (TPR) repeat protein